MKGYNGWSNYETWAVALWMDNAESSYRYVREMARDIVADAEDDRPEYLNADEYARFTLADKLHEEYEEAMPEVEGVWADLLRAGFNGVNWTEIATNIVRELEEVDA